MLSVVLSLSSSRGLEEDAVLEGQRDVKVDAIVEEVGEVLGVQPKFSLSEEQISSTIEAMKANAEVVSQIELTPENWLAEFYSIYSYR